jgi:virginiamycin B lyase
VKRILQLLIATCAVVAAGCGGVHSVAQGPQVTGRGGALHPEVLQNGKPPANWRTFSPAGAGGLFLDVVVGADKNLWFAEANNLKLVRVSMTGSVKIVTPAIPAFYLAVGADKKFYEGNGSSTAIGITTTGGVNKTINTPSHDTPSGLTLGPDNNVWFVEQNHVGKVTTAGHVTEYVLPTAGVGYGAITAGSDGNLWFTEHAVRKIAKVTTGGTVTEFSLPSSPFCYPNGIVKGPDHNVWFRCGSNVGRITTAGTFTLVPTPQSGTNGLENMAVGPDGNPWFTGDGTSIFEIDTTTLNVTTYTPPNTGFTDFTLVTGPDKNVWIGAYNHVINVYIPNPLSVAPNSIKFKGIGQKVTLTVTQHGTTSWTAKSSKPSVASVAPGSSANKFDVTSVARGAATITISDSIGNLFNVKVAVP